MFIYHSLGDYEANMERQTGFELGMRDFFQRDTYPVIDLAHDNWFEEFQELVQSMHRIAVFTDSEYIIFDLYSYFIKQGKIYNQDFDIVVYNNTNALKQLNLNIHYIDLPKKEMGKCAFDLLQGMMTQQVISDEDSVIHRVYTPNFII